MSKHTQDPWKVKMFDAINASIVPNKPKSDVIIGLVQMPGIGGPVTDDGRYANMRLIEEASYLFDVLCKAHDLSLDGKHEEARDWMRAAIDAVEQERLPENY